MAKEAQELYDFLKRIGSPGEAVLPGIVKDVHGDDTCDVEADGLVYYEVRLKAAVADEQKGILPKPKVGSVVIIERIGSEKSDEYQVVLFSELDAWSLEIATTKFLIDADGFELSKTGADLKTILNLLVQATQQIVVLAGNGPNYQKLVEATTKIETLFK